MPPKSIWRQPNAVHFQVVHRSHRDTLYNDPDAGQHVLKPISRGGKGKTMQDLVNDDPALARSDRKNIGEAALYGVYYDDTDYDYMQHLRAINDNENSKHGGQDEEADTEAVWIPSTVQPKERQKGFALKQDDKAPGIMLPASVFAGKEVEANDLAHFDVDPALQGLNPDMDPHLRQTLEALDDDAFVDDEADDDFFNEIIGDGAWDGVRTEDDAWRDAPPEGDDIWLDPVQRALREQEALRAQGGDQAAEEQLSLTARVALFKEQQQKSQAEATSDFSDEDRDELGDLPAPRTAVPARRAGSSSSTGSALGKKGKPGALARRAASSRAGSVGGGSTIWSMSSSAMARNQGLTELDERFDQVIRAYGGKATGDPEIDAQMPVFDEVEEEPEEELDEETVERLTRGDFEAIMDEFLETQEVIRGKLKQRLGGRDATSDEKLTILRKALGEARIVDGEDMTSPAEENPFLNPRIIGADREKWDVETIQSTKTNLENHPRTIVAASIAASARPSQASTIAGPRAVEDDVRIPKIRIHPRTGMPQIIGYTMTQKDKKAAKKAMTKDADDAPCADEDQGAHGQDDDEDADSDSDRDSVRGAPQIPAARPRTETAEERKARKNAVKEAKQQRRAEKSAIKKAFANELMPQQYAASGGAPSRSRSGSRRAVDEKAALRQSDVLDTRPTRTSDRAAAEAIASGNAPRPRRSSRRTLTEEELREREERRAIRAARAQKEAAFRTDLNEKQPPKSHAKPTKLKGRTSVLLPEDEGSVVDHTGDIERHAQEQPRSSRARDLAPVPKGQVGEMPEGRVFPFTGIDNLAELMETDTFHMACFSIYLFKSTLDYDTVQEFFEVLLQLYPKYRYVADLQPYSAERRDKAKRKQLKALESGPPGAREAYEKSQEAARAAGRLPFNPGSRHWYSKSLKSGSLLRPAQWRIDDDFHVSENIEVLPLGGNASEKKLFRVAGRFLARHFDYNKPLWEALLVQGLHTSDGGRSALMIKIHHSFSDGQGMIQSYHAALMAMSKDMGIKDVQQYADQMRAKKNAKPKTKRSIGATISHGFYTMRELYYMRRRTFLYKDPKQPRVAGRLYCHSEGIQMEQFKLIRKAFATDKMELTLNDVAIALLVRAMHQASLKFTAPGKKNDQRAAFFVPISLRPAGDWSLKNYTTGSLAWLPFPKDGDASIDEHLATVHREMRRMKNSLLPVLWYKTFDWACKHPIMYMPNYPVWHSVYQRTVSEYHVATNVPGPVEPVKFGKHEAYNYHVLPPSSPGKATLAIGMISYAKDFSLAVSCDDVPEFAELPQELCRCFQESAEVMINAARSKLGVA
ncbi:hypothetical protein MCUN1_000378 [Malassezia cuniculi]|uniref:long-chain-alcohol O-fatty-acyltransferase n=1 Tax=Malassezia cuniculi TaxID=948313 RepID=A0AAF0ENW4_9BASI|nr:hypothetical protein MCUN1_000378 [Malassezia cuniculi]